VRPDQPRDEFEIDQTPIWPDEDGRLEPIFLPGPLWIDFEDFDPVEMLPALETTAAASDDGPALIGFDEAGPGDVADDAPDGPPELSLWARRRASAGSVLGSFGVHLLTLLVLIGWTAAPAEMPGTIPVRLVLEAAAAPADKASATEAPAGEAVAESAGETPKTEDALPAAAAASPAPAPAPPPASPPPPRKLAAAAPPPRETSPKQTPPKRTPPKPRPVAAPTPPPQPAPPPPPEPPPATAAPARVAAAAPAAPALAGSQLADARPRLATAAPAMGGGDYLKELVVMTRGHLDVLPMSFLAGRRGRTTLSVLVIEDGTIGRISVKRSSGYPDIDARIEQMVAAVGRFPPVPASLQHPSVELDFDMSFPDAMQQ
jgi:TonB family protein